ncbi:MAG: DNA topoisomerase, partial [Planctomycetaceae bacterium]
MQIRSLLEKKASRRLPSVAIVGVAFAIFSCVIVRPIALNCRCHFFSPEALRAERDRLVVARSHGDREARSLRPTRAGMEVNDYLVTRLPHLFDVQFTARMEEQLDQIEEGSVAWTEMMRSFYGDFVGWVEEAKIGKVDPEELARLLELASE